MKKFGAKGVAALMLALAFVTVGGVYASWSFSSSTAGYGSSTKSMSVSVTSGSEKDELGEYEIDVGQSTVYFLDQYSYAVDNYGTSGTQEYSAITYGGTDSHNVALCVNTNAVVSVTIKVNTAAGDDAYKYGVASTISLTWNSVCMYNLSKTGQDRFVNVSSSDFTTYESDGYAKLLTSTASTITINPTNGTGNTWTKVDDGEFTYTFSGAELISLFNVSNVVISTYADYGYLANVGNQTSVSLVITSA